ncbi:transglycosylase SLT domain-containing protein [Pseudooceanicola sp. 502str34]|jgi:hypothetical protein|uniref:transglycosylase SLT domain-containing protein n=1 Tax=Maritimibacter alkaliphilus TaxID=404236 RepID=UPI001C97D243|nr:transglycosylase SLT domain-containing protein [Maritimibacter alkaliphilus]MBY6092187.1 transglycosylase SLT domain-containing protein [Maritimibacter alkaliphilus]
MSRTLRALFIVMLVASCGGGRYSAPNNLDDACSIVQERPKYFRAFKGAERRYGVPVSVQMAIMHQESKFIGNARTPHKYALGIIPMGRQSSAYGYSQALDGTWDDYKRASGNRRAKRDDIRDATDFMGWYMNETTKKVGVPIWDARNQYLAYHEGRAGYTRGNHNSKPWLIAVANNVQERSRKYEAQLNNCGWRYR